jgi:hypothetical protein
MRGTGDGNRVTPAHRYGLSGCVNPQGRGFLELLGFSGCETAERARGVARRHSLPQRENLCRPKLKGVTGTKQGRKGM